jgi:predicted dithiol-disulfide oxidoreductase (DUF899 family)
MDNIAGSLVHLTARDTSFAVISRAPIAKIEEFKRLQHYTGKGIVLGWLDFYIKTADLNQKERCFYGNP